MLSLLATLGLLFPMLLNLVGGIVVTATTSIGNVSTTTTAPKVTQEGCAIKIETTEKVEWKLPRQPIDLVIIQDASGSFEETMPKIKTALKTLTSPVDEKDYDSDEPRLVFTSDPDTSDRVMLTAYRGLDKERLFDSNVRVTNAPTGFRVNGNYGWQKVTVDATEFGFFDEYVDERGAVKDFYPAGAYNYRLRRYITREESSNVNLNGAYAYGYYVYGGGKYNITGADSNFTTLHSTEDIGGANYTFNKSSFLKSKSDIESEIDKIRTGGGTPTVPAIEDTLEQYNALKNTGFNQKTFEEQGRKTVFLLITDGVANGYRDPNSSDKTVYFDSSLFRRYTLANDWNTGGKLPEASQNFMKRAEELRQAGEVLKNAAGDNGKVVVGFWEDLTKFETEYGYLHAYRNAFGTPEAKNTLPGSISDNKSVQEVFSAALHSVASPDEVLPNGKPATYYVNEQNDVDVFAKKVLDSVTAAMVKENVNGEFEVTEGYKVESVTINGKKVVETVKDDTKEIPGTVKQEGRKVTISVPESVFNPGDNKFDYELKRTEEAENLDEADETEPPANYTPPKVEREVGQLVGTFKV
ncbi:hypothetical protein EAF07_10375, partial [Streptococcus hillyeri]